MSDELPLCPFCGERTIMVTNSNVRYTRYRLSCSNAECRVKPFGKYHTNKLAAIMAWNTRIPGWQPIETYKPKYGMVIVSGGVAHMWGGVWHTLTGEQWPGKPIQWKLTHWQPMPDPPPPTQHTDSEDAE